MTIEYLIINVLPCNQYSGIFCLYKWIRSGSNNLFSATRKQVYIATVNILLPSTWTDITDAEPSTEYTFTVNQIVAQSS